MSQQIIDVDGVPTLFSPVLAHSLEPGDLIDSGFSDVGVTRVDTIERTSNLWGPSLLIDTAHGAFLEFVVNAPVLRAVGARAGRGGAR